MKVEKSCKLRFIKSDYTNWTAITNGVLDDTKRSLEITYSVKSDRKFHITDDLGWGMVRDYYTYIQSSDCDDKFYSRAFEYSRGHSADAHKKLTIYVMSTLIGIKSSSTDDYNLTVTMQFDLSYQGFGVVDFDDESACRYVTKRIINSCIF